MISQRNNIAGRRTGNAGFSLIAAALVGGLILAFSVIIIGRVLSTRGAGRQMEKAIVATDIAEAGINKALYCLNAANGANCGGTYGTGYTGESNVSFGGGKFLTAVSGSGSTRTITATGTTGNGQSKIIAIDVSTIPPQDDTGFTYAMQSGLGGAHFENNSSLVGTMYSNGDIDCQSTNATIDGDAFSSKSGGKIENCWVKYHAHADKILNGKVTKDAYYKNDPTDISGTTVSGTKHSGSATPAVMTLPSVNLEFWHEAAEAGGTISGNYSPTDNSHLGPVKITGNLTLGTNVDVIIDGPVWVLGDITTYNNSSLTLNSSFGAYSTAILADDPADRPGKGKIHVVNNTAISGSGNPKSHIMVATTNSTVSDSSPAMLIENNASGAIFYALNGTLRLSNNGGAKAMAAYRLFVDQNATVTYLESEMSDQHYSNSPGGVWRVTEGSWHEVR